jgi:PAS domain S-box-containing protein
MRKESLSKLVPSQKKISLKTLLVALFVCTSPVQQALAKEDSNHVVLQLAGQHAFQFAGYYAAQLKGYYAEEGLNVEMRAHETGQNVVGEVLEANADFGTANSDIVYLRMQGQPVVALASIFQHSPRAIITRASSDIKTPRDLAGKTLAMEQNYQDIEILAMFKNAGVSIDDINVVKNQANLGPLMDGTIDAGLAHTCSQPYVLRQAGIKSHIMRPIEYGIDFYGDILFTSEKLLKRHPGRVAAFRRASLRGWEYAMEHPNELIDHILATCPGEHPENERPFTREYLEFEAKVMTHSLINPIVVEIGHMSPARWQRIAETYAELGAVNPDWSLAGFVYCGERKSGRPIFFAILGLFVGIIVVGLIGEIGRRGLRKAVYLRTQIIRETHAKHQRMVDNLIDSFLYRHSPDGVFTYISSSVSRVLGYTPEELSAHYSDHLTDHPANTKVRYYTNQCLRGFRQPPYELQIFHKNGKKRWLEVSESPVLDKKGEVIAIEGIAHEITHRKETETQLLRLAQATEQSSEIVLITDIDANITYVNPAFERVTGYSAGEVLGKNPRLLKSEQQDSAFYENMWKQLVSGNVWSGKLINKRKNGSLYTEDAIISPLLDQTGTTTNYVAVKRDITDALKLETQLRQSQKMEAVGQLAGGIAHDFNNLLQIILGYGEIISEESSLDSVTSDRLQDMLNAATRAKTLVSHLLSFSRQQPLRMQIVNLNDLISDLMKMMQRIIGENIILITEPAPELALIKADPGQLEQILVNLCVNARDAMPKGGTITIRTANVSLDLAFCKKHIWATPGPYARLSISDTGQGMDEKTCKKIFEPFFTTKEVGKGTGLGLSTVFGLIKQHKGSIQALSRPGEGTTFKIYLPELPKDQL